jgi:hypothetical protein
VILLHLDGKWVALMSIEFWNHVSGYSINEDHSLAKTAVGTPGYTGTASKIITLS